jgi:glycogen synthase
MGILGPSRMQPHRLLMTGDSLGGVWTYALELSRCLEQYNIEVNLATMGAPITPVQQDEASAIENLTIHESTFKLEWMDDPWDDLDRAGDWLLGLEQILSPDLIHLNTYAHAVLPWQAPTLIVGHSCVLSWWEAVKGGAAPSSWKTYRRAVQQGLQAAAMVICPSQAMLHSLERHYGIIADGRVIFNGLNPKNFKAPTVKIPFIFAAGRLWDEAKNIRALNAVAPKLAWPIYIAGDDRQPGGDKIYTSHLKTLGRVPAAEMKQWFARAAIYALPACYEPFGLSILEAALSGCALVLGNIDSLQEIWRDAALFVDPHDTGELFAALDRLTDKENIRKKMADQARRRALDLDSRHMAKAYIAVYEELLQKKKTTIHELNPTNLVH